MLRHVLGCVMPAPPPGQSKVPLLQPSSRGWLAHAGASFFFFLFRRYHHQVSHHIHCNDEALDEDVMSECARAVPRCACPAACRLRNTAHPAAACLVCSPRAACGLLCPASPARLSTRLLRPSFPPPHTPAGAFPFLRFDHRLPRHWFHKYQHIYMVRAQGGRACCLLYCLSALLRCTTRPAALLLRMPACCMANRPSQPPFNCRRAPPSPPVAPAVGHLPAAAAGLPDWRLEGAA